MIEEVFLPRERARLCRETLPIADRAGELPVGRDVYESMNVVWHDEPEAAPPATCVIGCYCFEQARGDLLVLGERSATTVCSADRNEERRSARHPRRRRVMQLGAKARHATFLRNARGGGNDEPAPGGRGPPRADEVGTCNSGSPRPPGAGGMRRAERSVTSPARGARCGRGRSARRRWRRPDRSARHARGRCLSTRLPGA